MSIFADRQAAHAREGDAGLAASIDVQFNHAGERVSVSCLMHVVQIGNATAQCFPINQALTISI